MVSAISFGLFADIGTKRAIISTYHNQRPFQPVLSGRWLAPFLSSRQHAQKYEDNENFPSYAELNPLFSQPTGFKSGESKQKEITILSLLTGN